MREEAGRGWRHVVPSPRPLRILNIETIVHMLDSAAVVIAAGGGGIPVVRGRDGQWRGVEAVIDKDFSSSLLASELRAEMYVVLTGVAKVAIDFEKPTQRTVDRLTVAEAAALPRRRPVPRRLDGPEDRSRHPVRHAAAASRSSSPTSNTSATRWPGARGR